MNVELAPIGFEVGEPSPIRRDLRAGNLGVVEEVRQRDDRWARCSAALRVCGLGGNQRGTRGEGCGDQWDCTHRESSVTNTYGCEYMHFRLAATFPATEREHWPCAARTIPPRAGWGPSRATPRPDTPE